MSPDEIKAFLDEPVGATATNTPTGPSAPPPYNWQPEPMPVNPADRTAIPGAIPRAINTALDWGYGGPIIRAGLRLAKNIPSLSYWFMSPEQKQSLQANVPSDVRLAPQLAEQPYSFRDIAQTPAVQAAYQSVRDVANIAPTVGEAGYNLVRQLHPERVFPFEVPPLHEREFARAPENLRQAIGKPLPPTLRPLPTEGAIYFMREAKGDRELARKMARDAGYTF